MLSRSLSTNDSCHEPSAPHHPGERLQEEFLRPLGVSQYRLAKAIGVPASRISEIVTGQRAISADTDLRLCRFLGLTPRYWLRAQAAYDTDVASVELADELEQIQPLMAAQRERPG
jgi:addiction module HigA family antidote